MPGHVAHEFEILRLVERAAVPAPRPILLDSEGHYFGVPAIVMSYLPGRPLFPTTNLGNWTRGLADVLWQLHNVRPERFDLSWLHVQLRDGMRARIEQWRTEPLVDPLAVDMLSVLDSELHQIDFSGPTLVHDDFWSGNTVASRGVSPASSIGQPQRWATRGRTCRNVGSIWYSAMVPRWLIGFAMTTSASPASGSNTR